MIPDLTTVLGGITRTLMMDLAPEVASPYGALTIQLSAGLLAMIAQEADRAAARLSEENEALVQLFGAADTLIADAQLRADLRTAVGARTTSLLVTDLRQDNRRLRALLIRLHAHVEGLENDGARALEQQVWNELVASTRRRHLDLAIA